MRRVLNDVVKRNYTIKRAVVPLLALALLAAACAGDDEPTTTAEQSGENAAESETTSAASVSDTVADAGVVRIGVRNDNPPMSFIDDNGEWVGFDVDLATAMAEQMGYELELVPVDGTTRISFLQEGQVDMSVASMNHTLSREEAIDFSITYFWDNQSFLVRTDSYGTIDELIGETVGANAGSSTIDSWGGYVEEQGGPAPQFVEFDDKLAAMQALRDGAIEGYTEDNITLLALAAGDPQLTLLPGGHNPVQFGIGVPENDSEWRDQVNIALQDVWTSGDFAAMYERWFEGPDRIIDLPLGGSMEIWS